MTETEWPARRRRFQIDESPMTDGRYRLYYSWPDEPGAAHATNPQPAAAAEEEPDLAGPGRTAPDGAAEGAGHV